MWNVECGIIRTSCDEELFNDELKNEGMSK